MTPDVRFPNIGSTKKKKKKLTACMLHRIISYMHTCTMQEMKTAIAVHKIQAWDPSKIDNSEEKQLWSRKKRINNKIQRNLEKGLKFKPCISESPKCPAPSKSHLNYPSSGFLQKPSQLSIKWSFALINQILSITQIFFFPTLRDHSITIPSITVPYGRQK